MTGSKVACASTIRPSRNKSAAMKTNSNLYSLARSAPSVMLVWSLLCAAGSDPLLAQSPCPEVGVITTGLLGPNKVILTSRGNYLVSELGPGLPNNGRISIVDRGGNRRTFLDGLPSALEFLGNVSGLSGLALHGQTLYVATAVGDSTLAGPIQGTEKANPSPSSPIFSSVLAIEFPEILETSTTGFAITLADQHALKGGASVTLTNAAGESTTLRLIVDFVDYIPEPTEAFPENVRHSSPYGLVADPTHLYIVDAGLNNVRKVQIATGTEQTLASFPPTQSPLTNGPPVMENVPTSIHWAGDQLLVTTFAGVPFLSGYSKVWLIDPLSGDAAPLVDGLTAAIDATPLSPPDLLAGLLSLEYNLRFPSAGEGQLRFYATPTSTPVTNSACLAAPSSMLYDAGADRLVLSELTSGRLVSLPVPQSPDRGNTWTRRADMPTPRIGLSTCTVNDKIYAIGGYRQAGARGMRTVEAYDPVTDSWTRKTDMPTARLMLACASVNGKIYAIGGDQYFLTNPMKIVEEYDPATDTWTRKADMPTRRSGLAAVATDGKIYVIGGLITFGAAPLSAVEAYDPVTDTWEQKAAMPTPRGLLHASVVNGKIYAIGSSGGSWLPTVEMYDPRKDSWTLRASMPTARGAAAGATADGRIYVMGGRNGSDSFATVEEYDPVSNTWTRRAYMASTTPPNPSRKWNFAGSAVNHRIYVFGGSYDISEPHPAVSLVLEYTPPLTPPVLEMKLLNAAGQSVLRLEWPSRSDCLDLLQTRNPLQPNGWTDVEAFSGTGAPLSKDLPASEGSGFYRLQRALR